MANLTLTVDEDLLRRARVRALKQGTSVNGLVRDWLEHFAGDNVQRQASEEIIAIGQRSNASSGRGGRKWARDDAYDERLGGDER